MKKQLIFGMLLFISMTGFFWSCQDAIQETNISPEALTQNSELTGMLRRVAVATAIDDNVLDSASCIRLVLPVEVTVNNQFLTISDTNGLQQASDILNQSNADNDQIVFNYPLQILQLEDIVTTVNNAAELQQFQQQCPWPDPAFPPIQCVDLVFPFTLSLYDTGAQTPQIVSITNSFDLLAFIIGLNSSQYYQVNYPITAIGPDGFAQELPNNAATLAFINAYGDNCNQCPNPHILTDDLIMYIPFANETVDLTGFAAPSVQGQFHYVTDRSGNPNAAISFDVGDQNNRIDTNLTTQNNLLQSGEFTISFWFNRQTDSPVQDFEQLYNNSELIVALGNQSNSSIRSPFVVASGLLNPLYDIGWIQTGMLGELGNWHHIALTFSGNTLRLYRDGALRNASSVVAFMGQQLGGGSLGGYFKGYLDDLRMYKRALTAVEIQQLYALEGDVNTCLD